MTVRTAQVLQLKPRQRRLPETVEYQLRSRSGRVVCAYENEERARDAQAQHGVSLRLFRVTRVEEEVL